MRGSIKTYESESSLYKHNYIRKYDEKEFPNLVNYENFRNFDGRLVSMSKNGTPIDRFIENKYSNIVIENPSKDEGKKKICLNSIILNLLLAEEMNQVVAISKDRNNYSIPRKYGLDHLKYKYVISFINRLEELDYLNQQIGFFDRETNIGKLTRIWAGIKLLEEMNDYFYSSSLIVPENSKYIDSGLILPNSIHQEEKIPYKTNIILKDSSKKPIDYCLTRKVSQMERFLSEYNELADSTEILSQIGEKKEPNLITSNIEHKYNNYHRSIQIDSLYPLLIQIQPNSLYYNRLPNRLHRVFNQSKFNQGGRFYGAGHQWIKKELRTGLLINGETTTELDYSAMHIQMLYNQLSIQYEGDPYNIIGIEYRRLMKLISLIAINSENRTRAIQAFNNELMKNPELHQAYVNSGLKTPQLFEKFENKHNKISSYFNSGVGRDLQYQDSKIAEKIMKYFTKKGILVSPVHDSFIIDSKYKDELEDVMKEVYWKQTCFNCKIK